MLLLYSFTKNYWKIRLLFSVCICVNDKQVDLLVKKELINIMTVDPATGILLCFPSTHFAHSNGILMSRWIWVMVISNSCTLHAGVQSCDVCLWLAVCVQAGRSSKRQLFLLPGGIERHLKIKTCSVSATQTHTHTLEHKEIQLNEFVIALKKRITIN